MFWGVGDSVEGRKAKGLGLRDPTQLLTFGSDRTGPEGFQWGPWDAEFEVRDTDGESAKALNDILNAARAKGPKVQVNRALEARSRQKC